MIAKETIAEIAIQTVNDYQPERVILFGSVATEMQRFS